MEDSFPVTTEIKVGYRARSPKVIKVYKEIDEEKFRDQMGYHLQGIRLLRDQIDIELFTTEVIGALQQGIEQAVPTRKTSKFTLPGLLKRNC